MSNEAFNPAKFRNPKDDFHKIIEGVLASPAKIAIMGETGVGKSSLFEALFDVELDISHDIPSTADFDNTPLVKVVSEKDQVTLELFDLRGIGNNPDIDEERLIVFKEKMLESDIIIWAISSDSRSVSFGIRNFEKLIKSFEHRAKIVYNKIIFVLTKIDHTQLEPWLYIHNSKLGYFEPGEKNKEVIKKKVKYFSSYFVEPYENFLSTSFYVESDLNINVEGLDIKDGRVRFEGFLSPSKIDIILGSKEIDIDEIKAILFQIIERQEVIPVSSKFMYNIDYLVKFIFDRISSLSIDKFKKIFVDGSRLLVTKGESETIRNFHQKKVRKSKL